MYKKEIAKVAVIAVVVAVGLGALAIFAFPGGHYGSVPEALLGLVSALGVSCSLATGVCTFTVVNNSSVPLEPVSCGMRVILEANSSGILYGSANGTIGGPVTGGIPANSITVATCTVPVAKLSLQTRGSSENGLFAVNLVDNWY